MKNFCSRSTKVTLNTSINSLKSNSNSINKSVVLGLAALMLLVTFSSISWTPISTDNKTKTIAVKTTGTIAALTATQLFDQYVTKVYTDASLQNSGMNYETLKKAITGYYNLKHDNKLSAKSLITIIDFNKPSTEKRLWILDLEKNQVLFNTLVAHGKGSGDNFATSFSNVSESNQSSLGFYIASNTYNGKHGLSLRLNGLDNGFNTNALNRAVVVHGAEYVNQDFINQHGRLGRSLGCPALPVELTNEIITTIKGNTCLFIEGPKTDYKSDFLNEENAANDYSILAGNTMNASI